MSSAFLHEFEGGLPAPERTTEFRNSWGGAARIWSALAERHLKGDSWRSEEDAQRVWALAERTDLPMCDRVVNAFTFDLHYVGRVNFQQFAVHLREFRRYHRPSGICHLEAWAELISKSSAEAVGLYATSVSDDPWYRWDEEADEEVPYNMLEGTDHVEIYEWLDGLSAEEK